MKKRILLIGYNYHPEQSGIGKYNGEMVRWFSKNGYQCEVLTTYPYYPYWKVQEPYHKSRLWFKTKIEQEDGINTIKVHRCPAYIPANPTGLKRMLLDSSFFISAFFKSLQLIAGKKFDFVIVVSPSFNFGLLGVFYKKFHKSRFVYHIQDLQIEAARDLGMITSRRILNILFKVERYILNKADHISSISDGMINKIEKKIDKKVLSFPNWTDINLFKPLEGSRDLKKEFGFEASDVIILYSGAVGKKQGLETILYAAKALKEQKELKFLICGSGPYKENIEKLAVELGLDNVIFFPQQPFEKFNSFLNMADLHLIIQKGEASDLVMPSKLTTILAVGGLAIITANKGSTLYDVVSEHEMGILIKPEDTDALVNSIVTVLKTDHSKINANARGYAEEFLAIDKIFSAFSNQVFFS